MHIFDSLIYADVEQEGFDTLFEEHPGVLSNINRAFSKACKTKLQEILYESENGEIPLKLKIYSRIFPRSRLKIPVANGGGNAPS